MLLRSLALAVAALLLGSCGGDDPEPIPAPEPTTTPTSAEPTPTETPEPETPEEFIRRWVQLNTEVQNTGDSTEFLAASAKGCQTCSDLAAKMGQIYSAGGFVRTDGWTVKAIRPLNAGDQDRPEFIVELGSAPTEYRESENGELKTFPGGDTEFRFVLIHRSNSWLMFDYIEQAS